jgi:phosphatidylglycerophosphatase C
VAAPGPPTVAAFDFDGTLTRRDTLLPFLRLVAGDGAVMRAGLRHAPRLVAARLDDARRDDAKAALLRDLLAGRDAEELRELGRRHARRVLDRELRPDVVALLERHREQGHRTVIVSASLAVVVDPVGEALGVDTVLATTLEVDDAGRLTGELVGANCRRAEKVRRLEEWLAGSAVRLCAYGDSRGDEELLARADEAHRIGRRPPR